MRGRLAALALIAAAPCLVAAPLGGCATPAATSYPKARTALERADEAFARVDAAAQLALPYLPPIIAGRVVGGLEMGRAALSVAHATSGQARLAALAQLASAVATVIAAMPEGR